MRNGKITPLYERISRDDELQGESNTWGEAHPLTGLMYCADCGGKMYVHRTNNGKRIPQYTCSQYTKVPCGTLCPPSTVSTPTWL